MLWEKGHKVNLGRKLTPEIRAKISAATKGRSKSEDSKAKMRAHKKTPEHNHKVSEALKGRAKTPEHIANLTKTMRDRFGKPRVEKLARLNVRNRNRQIQQAGRPPPENCEVCGTIGKLCFDHDHESGLFRGWICHHCNTALGMAGDSIEVLEKLIVYLGK